MIGSNYSHHNECDESASVCAIPDTLDVKKTSKANLLHVMMWRKEEYNTHSMKRKINKGKQN